jgi:hypothetical protein
VLRGLSEIGIGAVVIRNHGTTTMEERSGLRQDPSAEDASMPQAVEVYRTCGKRPIAPRGAW